MESKVIKEGYVLGYELKPLTDYDIANIELDEDTVVSIYRYKGRVRVTIFNTETNKDIADGYLEDDEDLKIGTFGGIEVDFKGKGRWPSKYHLWCSSTGEGGPYEIREYPRQKA